MKKIIIVAFTPPYPLSHGGNRQVIYNLLLWLRKNKYHIQFVYQSNAVDQGLIDFTESLVDEFYPVCKYIYKDDKNNGFINRVINFFKKKIHKIRFVDVRPCWLETKNVVEELCKDSSVKAVIVEYIYIADVLDVVPANILKLIHTHDMISRVKKEIGDVGGDTQGREVSEEFEKSKLNKCDVIIALQKYEAALFKKMLPEKKVIILGHYCRESVERPVKNIVKNSILFVGGDNPLNRRGLALFCKHSWPRVLELVPDATLRVAGPVGSSLPNGLSNSCALGRLSDSEIDQEYRSANLVINPVDLGTGLKIKTIEALSYGKALVSTENGIEGLIENDDVTWLVAAGWDDFAECTVKLLIDDEFRERIELNVLSYTKKYLTEDYVYQAFKCVLQE